ncbi:Cyclin-dependent kinase G-2-like [Heracleum sosnowskyi]|uniref:Cyclin-dependent kinase G-2-like n=1 Tax=Heracleum sosnowskyi TaxID=360622 RepID=A0AAD8I1A6_9APIA|nr:Cyclin-dependent kinase G-2-like [Heracleum sosnowskyi]
MEGRGGCCIARYGGGGGYNDMSKVDRIMLKYRPIAPKPVVAGASKPESADLYVKTPRPKRRYVRDCKRKRIGTGRSKVTPEKSSSGGSSSGGETVVTLPLLAEIPEREESPVRVGKKAPIWLSFDRKETVSSEGHVAFPVAKPVRAVGSCVRVECVMDTWVDRNGLGKTDEEKVMNLERDTCPGFVSDGYNVVKWTNKAYTEMVGEVNGEMMVWLVMKDLVLLPLMSEAFTCRVRVSCRKDGGSLGAMTVPCDVWRMNNGGFAWRLDIKAALCLGR